MRAVIQSSDSKYQDTIPTPYGEFSHPYFQCLLMYIGEAIFFYISWIKTGTITKINPFIFCIPTAIDYANTSLTYVALSKIGITVYQIVRSSIVIFTAVFSIIILRKVPSKQKWLGMFIIVSGVVVVGFSSVNKNNHSKTKTSAFGVILLVIALMFGGLFNVVEEKLLSKYNLPPMETIGREGIYGIGISLISMPLLQFLGVDSSTECISQIFTNWKLGLTSIVFIITIGLYGLFGISITKYFSALTRTTIDISKLIIIWIASMIIGWEKFMVLELIGSILVIAGIVVYNEVFKIGILSSESTK